LLYFYYAALFRNSDGCMSGIGYKISGFIGLANEFDIRTKLIRKTCMLKSMVEINKFVIIINFLDYPA